MVLGLYLSKISNTHQFLRERSVQLVPGKEHSLELSAQVTPSSSSSSHISSLSPLLTSEPWILKTDIASSLVIMLGVFVYK